MLEKSSKKDDHAAPSSPGRAARRDAPLEKTMSFKDSAAQYQLVDLALIAPDAGHARQNIDDGSLKGLANAIRRLGLIHPLIVQPADADGRYRLIVGERRRQAALLAGERTVPVLIRACTPAEAREAQVFENLGLGVRAPLEARDMANAIRKIADGFATPGDAATYFDRPPTWLDQATAAAKLSDKVSALLDAGKITSTGAAVQLEKLARKNEAKAESLIEQIEQLPEGEKVAKKVVDHALAAESGRRKKAESPTPKAEADAPAAPLEDLPPPVPMAPAATAVPSTARRRVNPGKIRQVGEILGLNDGDEEEILIRLIDEFLALKQA